MVEQAAPGDHTPDTAAAAAPPPPGPTGQSGTAKVIVEVTAGVIPGRPEPAYSRRWPLTSQEWYAVPEDRRLELLAQANGQAQGYAALLMLQPSTLNWVRLDWLLL